MTTLSYRFPRVAAVMSAVKENDYDTLRESVLDVDVSIEKQCQELKAKRWAQVAELMEKKGTELYPVRIQQYLLVKLDLTIYRFLRSRSASRESAPLPSVQPPKNERGTSPAQAHFTARW